MYSALQPTLQRAAAPAVRIVAWVADDKVYVFLGGEAKISKVLVNVAEVHNQSCEIHESCRTFHFFLSSSLLLLFLFLFFLVVFLLLLILLMMLLFPFTSRNRLNFDNWFASDTSGNVCLHIFDNVVNNCKTIF